MIVSVHADPPRLNGIFGEFERESARMATIREPLCATLYASVGAREPTVGDTVEQVTALQPAERVRLDADRLDALYRQFGLRGAEDVVCRALEEIAARLARAERDYRAARFADMRKGCRGLVGMSEEVGMSLMARVARDVTACIDAGDGPALGATFARLLRTAERSLCEIWDLQDGAF